MKPYYSDEQVTLYLGRMEDVLPELGQFDCAVADPPYGETSLAWDRWPDGWPALVAEHARSMWCFGSLRMFLDRRDEFAGWKLSQDVVWEKHNGSGLAADRFRRVHEHTLHWYQGHWRDTHHSVPRIARTGKNQGTRRVSAAPQHQGHANSYTPWCDDGTRLMRSVIPAKSMKGRAIHPTEKPTELLGPLIAYACPPGGIVLDPFAGSASTLVAARDSGRRAVGIERHEPYAEAAAKRLQQASLFSGEAS